MTAEQIFDAALAMTRLSPRGELPLDGYGYDDGTSPRICYRLAVKMARLGEYEDCLMALQHAEAHVFRFTSEAA